MYRTRKLNLGILFNDTVHIILFLIQNEICVKSTFSVIMKIHFLAVIVNFGKFFVDVYYTSEMCTSSGVLKDVKPVINIRDKL